MKKTQRTQPASSVTRGGTLLRKKRGRLTAFCVFALVTASVVISTVAWAQTKRGRGQKRPATEVTLESQSRLERADTAGLKERKAPGRASHTPGQTSIDDGDLFADPKPREERLVRARDFKGDLRNLAQTPPDRIERPEREAPDSNPRVYVPPAETTGSRSPKTSSPIPITPAVPAPTPLITFDGLDFANWGAGHPPDTNGDVGPTYYIQTINTSIGIYNKTGGAPVAAFTFNTFMSQGNFGNLCDTNNFGDPVVLYDTFEDRWIITDFAFQLSGGSVVNPPGSFQCFAASKTGDPVSGGWNFYSINTTGGLGDYPKLGIWPDGLYMSVNMFAYQAGGLFQNARAYAFNKAQMYAGEPSVQSVSFDAPANDFTILPSNARLQTGTPPPGTPNYFLSTWEFLNALTIYKFHVDWTNVFNSTFTGPDTPLAASSWPNAGVPNAPSQGGNALDVLQIRAMMQNQYTNLGGVESLWAAHTVRRANTSGFAAPRWYQVDVTGGTVNANIPQTATWDPDGANLFHRFMPSVAVDHAGNMALGYSTSSSTTKPAINYAGRLSTDPINTLSLTEQLLIQGTGTQTGTCGGATCTRWGDYSAMTLDPNGCTFWYTNMYYAIDGLNFLTRIGSFAFSPCTTVGSGTIQGTVTATPGGAPINGATVALGSRSTTTNASGFYSFAALPSGTYPTETASAAGRTSSTTTSIVVSDGGTTVKDFSLGLAISAGCLTDTLQTDFQRGVPTNVDLNTSPNDIILTKPSVDQQNINFGTSGVGVTITTWGGQTFTPAVTGPLTKADISLFCSGCSGTTPNLTLSVSATAAGLPVGPDLATATITGFSSGAAIFYTGTFGAPATLTAGTMYALLIRPTANPSAGIYAMIRSGTSTVGNNVYAGGTRVSGATSGTVWSIPTTGGVTTDGGFRTYMDTGFAASGNQISDLKDANPGGGSFAHWTGFSWTATTPANTTVKFQAAGSNSATGPFNFIGPDGTAGTFYTSTPTNLFQFSNFRYLKYKAYLSTTDSAATPTLSSVTVCLNDTSLPTAAPAKIGGMITTPEGTPLAGVTVRLTGATSATAITDGTGVYHFSGVGTDSFYTVTPAAANFHFSPANRSFSLLADKADTVFTAVADDSVSANAIDTNEYFVRQHYLDFLGREPDREGFAYWNGKLRDCNGEAACVRGRRIEVSAAFFNSREFQETGAFVYNLYAGMLGRAPGLAEFAPDRDKVVGGANLEQAKLALATEFVNRTEFVAKYPNTLSREEFVDSLLQSMQQRSGVEASSWQATLTAAYNSGGRPAAVRAAVGTNAFVQAESYKAFVLMEYFGYLRRDADRVGYDYWLNVLNNDSGNYRGMVCSFITSTEYQRRFGALVLHSNAECAQ